MAGIYLHIPFCKQACYYCDFHFSTSIKKKSAMVQALARELNLRKNEVSEPVETIYFGGGTPSLLSVDEIQFLIQTIDDNFKIADDPEITLEANPDDLSEQKIKELSKSPVNRLSIGIQSFFDEDLKMMNRAHTGAESINCLSAAIGSFENITVDLIYGIPNMSIEKWRKNLASVFNFGIPHISSYALTVEPKTALESFIKKGKYLPMDDQLAEEHFYALMEETDKYGFVQYEISNFAKPDFFSKHNTAYWKGNTYLGIGPSAHSFNGSQRSWNIANNARYIKSIEQGVIPSQTEILSKKDRFNEYIMTGLRTIWGISIRHIEDNFGDSFKNNLLKNAEKHIKNQTLICNAEMIHVTQKGKFLADGIASDMFIV